MEGGEQPQIRNETEYLMSFLRDTWREWRSLRFVVLRIVVAKSRPVQKLDDPNPSSEAVQTVLRIVAAESRPVQKSDDPKLP